MAIRMQRSSGNVFADLGFPSEEAARLLIRSDLMGQLRVLIAEHRTVLNSTSSCLVAMDPSRA